MNLPRSVSVPTVALALMGVALVGCSPTPAPTPSPTAVFASEEEAFAAAEETYRAYNDVLNQVDTGDPQTFEELFSFSSGDFEAADRKTFSELYAAEYKLTGETRVASFRGLSADQNAGEVVAAVCVDVSLSDVVDRDGNSVTPPDRPNLNPLIVTFATNEEGFTISRATRDDGSSCASK